MDSQNLVVNEEELTIPPVSEDENTQNGMLEVEEETPAPKAGDKTNPNLLLKSLQDERDENRILKKKLSELEEKLNSNSSSDVSDDVFSDEGKLLKREIDSLKSKILEGEEREALSVIMSTYPALKDVETEFDEYRKKYPLVELDSIAKLFLNENGMLNQKRKGLLRPTGGDKTPVPSGMTTQEVETLRKNNGKKYREMLKKGQIKIIEG
jgi:small-conductance mechanosensitive channel